MVRRNLCPGTRRIHGRIISRLLGSIATCSDRFQASTGCRSGHDDRHCLRPLRGPLSEGPQRNKAMEMFIAVISGGFAAGSIVGGILTTFVGWRSVMFANVPIGIVSIILTE